MRTSYLGGPRHYAVGPLPRVDPASLGCAAFRRDHGLRYAYVAGAMYKGIASPELVVAMGRAGCLAFLGTGGMRLEDIESGIQQIQDALAPGQPYGANVLCNPERPELEDRTVDVLLAKGVRAIEAAGFSDITPSLVRYRLKGRHACGEQDRPAANRVLAKVSRPEVAVAFMSPPPPSIVRRLVAAGQLSEAEADAGRHIPMADDVCVEADSAGHTDRRAAIVLLPVMLLLRDELMATHGYLQRIRVGAAGGIGTPQAAAAAFLMGADFILTGSINQCTVEASTSAAVKDLLQEMSVQDTAYAPAGDAFESDLQTQVLKKGLFFPMRAARLRQLYDRHGSLDELDAKTRLQIEEKWFGRSFEDVWTEARAHYLLTHPQLVTDADTNPKRKMALVFKWYFTHTSRLAREGRVERRIDFQVHCGPALGAFNRWVKGTSLEPWRNRRVAVVAETLMKATSACIDARIAGWLGTPENAPAQGRQDSGSGTALGKTCCARPGARADAGGSHENRKRTGRGRSGRRND